MSFKIIKASISDLKVVSDLAHEIWPESYSDILCKEQIDFMLAEIYSVKSIERAIENGQEFYLALEDLCPVGFLSIRQLEDEILRIEKLYLHPKCQGKGYGHSLIEKAISIAKEYSKTILELNVNRKNRASQFYLRKGFEIVREVDIPYHEFILDDYIMQKVL